MHFTYPLYLASQSSTRQQLLKEARIPFALLPQNANENIDYADSTPQQVVASLVLLKMGHVSLPQLQDGTTILVLTADTLCLDSAGNLHGKPKDYDEAHEMLKLWRNGCTVLTGFCLDKKKFQSNSWHTINRIEQQVSSTIDFHIEDAWLSDYLKYSAALSAAGAMTIEGYGFQFVKSIEGSYSNILGLPLYEVRQALKVLGFYGSS
jgi:septum formation protein